jgi:uncharacterized membrane protein YfcA
MEIFDTAPILFVLALRAGLVDSIAGGRPISVPALLWAGLPPVTALATNKGSGRVRKLYRHRNFHHRRAVDVRRAAFSVVCTFLGAAAGAFLVQHLESDLLARIIPLLLVAFALSFMLLLDRLE